MAEGGALLRRYGGEFLHRGFEALLLRLTSAVCPLPSTTGRIGRAAEDRRSGATPSQLAACREVLAPIPDGPPDRLRDIWIRRDVVGQTYEEIAATLGMTPKQVRLRYARARQWLHGGRPV